MDPTSLDLPDLDLAHSDASDRDGGPCDRARVAFDRSVSGRAGRGGPGAPRARQRHRPRGARAAAPGAPRCAICASDAVETDEAFDRGLWLLSECGRCGHRWTAGPLQAPNPVPARVRPVPATSGLVPTVPAGAVA